uniref:Uncharacterized protein n=1 Tax=Pristionchus pacificus TaxID=54126 RepID=A0A2A6C5R6_PRIPA|eukprot:PDM73447.1 hypothetical protein PRIPAC_40803 [Pristionchus pacificus]
MTLCLTSTSLNVSDSGQPPSSEGEEWDIKKTRNDTIAIARSEWGRVEWAVIQNGESAMMIGGAGTNSIFQQKC